MFVVMNFRNYFFFYFESMYQQKRRIEENLEGLCNVTQRRCKKNILHFIADDLRRESCLKFIMIKNNFANRLQAIERA